MHVSFIKYCKEGNLDEVKRLVPQNQLSPLYKKEWTSTKKLAIKIASRDGYLELLKYLVSIGCDPYQRCPDWKGDHNDLIEEASKNGHLDVVKYLVSIGCYSKTDDNYPL